MWKSAERCFRTLQGKVDYCSLRLEEEHTERLSVRQGRVQPMALHLDRGAMITVIHAGGYGYAATSDVSDGGLEAAFAKARAWAAVSARRAVFDFALLNPIHPVGEHHGSGTSAPLDWHRPLLIDRLMKEAASACLDDRIVDWGASLTKQETHQQFFTSGGGAVEQTFRVLMPNLSVTAHANGETQTRTLGGQYNGYCRQGGLNILSDAGFDGAGRRLADEALQLLTAPNCPTGKRDLLLMPSQMIMQVHESIGHPLELDRILGDERNRAGTSFVTLDMFGHFQYGSPLLNVTYDPGRANELAAFAWDDDGTPAKKVHLIRKGRLEQPLGGLASLRRAQEVGVSLTGVANSRASGWNRPPIDRMGNLNLEPGNTSFKEMISQIESGVLMDSNVSWSIDDSRRNFQFGCEWGQLIENGELKGVVKNPGYRGTSTEFWHSLKAVGDARTFDVMGTPYCCKGEPLQMIPIGHASPACVFGEVDVFGGES